MLAVSTVFLYFGYGVVFITVLILLILKFWDHSTKNKTVCKVKSKKTVLDLTKCPQNLYSEEKLSKEQAGSASDVGTIFHRKPNAAIKVKDQTNAVNSIKRIEPPEHIKKISQNHSEILDKIITSEKVLPGFSSPAQPTPESVVTQKSCSEEPMFTKQQSVTTKTSERKSQISENQLDKDTPRRIKVWSTGVIIQTENQIKNQTGNVSSSKQTKSDSVVEETDSTDSKTCQSKQSKVESPAEKNNSKTSQSTNRRITNNNSTSHADATNNNSTSHADATNNNSKTQQKGNNSCTSHDGNVVNSSVLSSSEIFKTSPVTLSPVNSAPFSPNFSPQTVASVRQFSSSVFNQSAVPFFDRTFNTTTYTAKTTVQKGFTTNRNDEIMCDDYDLQQGRLRTKIEARRKSKPVSDSKMDTEDFPDLMDEDDDIDAGDTGLMEEEDDAQSGSEMDSGDETQALVRNLDIQSMDTELSSYSSRKEEVMTLDEDSQRTPFNISWNKSSRKVSFNKENIPKMEDTPTHTVYRSSGVINSTERGQTSRASVAKALSDATQREVRAVRKNNNPPPPGCRNVITRVVYPDGSTTYQHQFKPSPLAQTQPEVTQVKQRRPQFSLSLATQVFKSLTGGSLPTQALQPSTTGTVTQKVETPTPLDKNSTSKRTTEAEHLDTKKLKKTEEVKQETRSNTLDKRKQKRKTLKKMCLIKIAQIKDQEKTDPSMEVFITEERPIECDGCLEKFSTSEISWCEDHHRICLACVKAAILQFIRSKETRLVCCSEMCENSIGLAQINPQVDRSLYELLKHKLEKRLAKAEKQMIVNLFEKLLCTHCKLEILQPKDEIFFQCSHCKQQTELCKICHRPKGVPDKHVECKVLQYAGSHCFTDLHSFPDNWERVNTLSETDEPFDSLCSVELSSNEGKAVVNMFSRTIGSNTQVKSIMRIQKTKQWQKYCLKRKHMVEEIGLDKIKERALFHGTKKENIDLICQEGFDMRVKTANGALYGKGIYFSPQSNYSKKYAADCSQMFIARVLCGYSTRGSSDMTRPPKHSSGRMYDTCVDNVDRPGIFSVFDNAQCYPAYIIEYS
ncbi:uncharacterized protein LOC131952285 [Physella acuta]|uniref:uncharacterized protein LOC131952285 n=1 Tax=Physella acuta TaxID=109671 RepID=UPI0027DB03CB|nr:uncharacterized protein LOC131952285 [Physella acuta]XP_059170875.1 uncharacterized protein LOC131952285 [Physella acuta]